MKLPLAWQLAWRYLRGRRSRLLSGTARAAILAASVGVTAMVVAMALMSGYREDLQRKLIGGNAAVIAYPLGSDRIELGEAELDRVAKIPGVIGVGAVFYAQGALSAAAGDGLDVTLRGVDAGNGQLAASPELLALDSDGLAGVVIGRELARRLGVEVGEVLRLVVLGFEEGRPRFHFRSVYLADTFATGFAEFDDSWVVVDRRFLESLVGSTTASRLYELTLEDPSQAPAIAATVQAMLAGRFLVTDWQRLNRELFTALRLQQWALFLVLGLIVLVSTFNVASTLVVLIRERMRDLGILSALGLSRRELRSVFVIYGLILGATGTALGVAIGGGLAWILTTFELIRFDPEVAAIYFISSVPFRLRWVDLAAVIGFTLVVTVLACWLPARKAVSVAPSDALRYE